VNFSFVRVFAMVRKEFIQITRDRQSLMMIIAIPIMMLILYGYGITSDIKNIPLAVYDPSPSQVTRDFIGRFQNSGYFSYEFKARNVKQIINKFDGGTIKAALIFDPDFSKNIRAGRPASLQILIDGSDANTANVALGYINAIVQSYSGELMLDLFKMVGGARRKIEVPVTIEPRVWYNPTLSSSHFLIPGLICVIMTLMTILLASLALVTEKERGTLEQLVVSPMQKIEIILGKLIPYGVISFTDLIMVIIAGEIMFRIPFRGDIVFLLVSALVFVVGALGVGLLISSIARTGQEAIIMSFLSTMLPAFLLSGFVFPISSMPFLIRSLTYVIPARYFITITRGIFLKGIGIDILWPEFTLLSILGIILVSISVRRFRKNLE
jgi:ABC-2 type transport system permease protein